MSLSPIRFSGVYLSELGRFDQQGTPYKASLVVKDDERGNDKTQFERLFELTPLTAAARDVTLFYYGRKILGLPFKDALDLSSNYQPVTLNTPEKRQWLTSAFQQFNIDQPLLQRILHCLDRLK